VRQISEVSVRDGGEMLCVGGWGRGCLLAREESGVITMDYRLWRLDEMTDEMVTVDFVGREVPSRSGFSARKQDMHDVHQCRCSHMQRQADAQEPTCTRAQETAQLFANGMRHGSGSQA
jgi:hypothetical protein